MLTSFRTTTLTISRPAAGSFDARGDWSDGSDTTFEIQCSLQPASPTDLMSLPEGRRNIKTFMVITDTELRQVIQGTGGANADRTTIYGEEYECFQALPWQNNVMSHFETFFQLVEKNSD